MSTGQWAAVVMVVAWAGAIVCVIGLFVTKYREVLAEEAAPAPGGLTADLGDCWAIWPDAPLATVVGDDD